MRNHFTVRNGGWEYRPTMEVNFVNPSAMVGQETSPTRPQRRTLTLSVPPQRRNSTSSSGPTAQNLDRNSKFPLRRRSAPLLCRRSNPFSSRNGELLNAKSFRHSRMGDFSHSPATANRNFSNSPATVEFHFLLWSDCSHLDRFSEFVAHGCSAGQRR